MPARSFGSSLLSMLNGKPTTEGPKSLEETTSSDRAEKVSEEQQTEVTGLTRRRRDLITRRNIYRAFERKLDA